MPQATGDTGEHRVHHDETNAQVRTGERRARVKAEPAERQDERADNNHRHVVTGHSLGPALRVVLADARADDHRARQRDNAAHRVHDARTGEVDRAVAKAPIDTALSEPTAAPDPVGIEAIGQAQPISRKEQNSSTPSVRPSRPWESSRSYP